MASEKTTLPITRVFMNFFYSFPKLIVTNVLFGIPLAAFFGLFYAISLINGLPPAAVMLIRLAVVIPVFPFYAGVAQVTAHLSRGERDFKVTSNFFAAVKESNINGANFKNTVRAFAVNILPFVYPALLLLTMLCANELNSGFICLVLIFVISPCADTFAYLVGMTYNKIRKGNAKRMCPNLSPKKTWAGAIGGVIGGVIGAIVVYFAVDKTAITETAKISPIIAFVLIGFFASILTEIGDLFESFIKRKVGIKDMGRILPGHGGIMDRIDGMSFAAVFVFLTFLLLL